MFSFLFDSSGSNRKKALRKNQRDIQRLIRELDRERLQLEKNSATHAVDLKKYAKEQNMPAMRTIAKSIVRNRAAITKLHHIKSQLQAVSLRMAEVNSQQAMADAMKGTTKALGSLNKKMLKSSGISEALKEFERQKMYNDGYNESFEDEWGESEEEEMEFEIGKVLHEVTGEDMVELVGGLGDLGIGAGSSAKNEDHGDDLVTRLRAVKGLT
jgi:charged multivesicular body protein 2A